MHPNRPEAAPLMTLMDAPRFDTATSQRRRTIFTGVLSALLVFLLGMWLFTGRPFDFPWNWWTDWAGERATKKARELEVAVLGNDDPKASVVGEIIPGKEFYDYEAKYLSDGSIPVIPAKITAAESKQIRAMAVEAFRACDLAGLARVDFLMEPDGRRRIYLNEVNTLPGFTSISMYPKLWQATGLSYADLITRLIELALERHQERSRTSFSFEVPN